MMVKKQEEAPFRNVSSASIGPPRESGGKSVQGSQSYKNRVNPFLQEIVPILHTPHPHHNSHSYKPLPPAAPWPGPR